MESIMGEAATQGLDLGAPAVIISARFARHTCCTAALVAAWQMFRAVPPRARSALVYAEMMVRASACRRRRLAARPGMRPPRVRDWQCAVGAGVPHHAPMGAVGAWRSCRPRPLCVARRPRLPAPTLALHMLAATRNAPRTPF